MIASHPYTPPGELFATEGIDRVTEYASAFCANQQRHIEASNHGEIQALKAKGSLLSDEREGLRKKIANEERVRRHRPGHARLWNACVAAALTIAAFAFALMTFDPFQLGWKPYLYCIGLAIVGLFAVDHFLREWPHPNVIKTASIALLSAALPTIVLLAMIRGDILAHSEATEAPVIVDGATEETPPDDTTERTILFLRFAMVFAALGFELAAGLALHEFRNAQQLIDDDPLPQIRQELTRVEGELLAVIQRLAELESEAAAYGALFWSDFYRGLITRAIRGMTSAPLILVALFALAVSPMLRAADRLDLVIALDLSQTELAKGPAGKSEFDENVRAITTLLATMPPASRVTVIGITPDSFATPYVILSARLSDDPGPFSSRLSAGRRTMDALWTKKARGLSPSFLRTDVLGAINYASLVLSQSAADRKVIAVLSDARHQAHGLDLETPERIDIPKTLSYVERHQLFAPLAGLDVFVFAAGGHGGNKEPGYWNSLHAFWAEYFRRCGATLRWFSPGREREALIRVTAGPEPTKAQQR